MESVVTKVGETRDILSHGVQPQVRKALSHGVCPIPKPPVILGKKTLQNYSSKFKHTILSTPKRQAQFHEYELKKMSLKHNELVTKVVKNLNTKFNENNTVDVCSTIHQKLTKDSPKTNPSYAILAEMSPLVTGEKVSSIRKKFKVSFNVAKKISVGDKIKRKESAHKFCEVKASKIKSFYVQDDISFVDPSIRRTTKKGITRFMTFPLRVAHQLFEEQNPDIKVSFSKFKSLRPKNVRFISETPLKGCACVYCENVRLKLIILFPKITSVYDLYNNLICKKHKDERFRNSECIFKTCKDCKNWENTIRNMVPATDLTRNVSWEAWVNTNSVTKYGKKNLRRERKLLHGTIAECLDEFISIDILQPVQGFSFVKHYFLQHYQYQMYKDCISALTSGECLFLQDFSRNREVYKQDDIKSSHWSKKQISVHPTVIYYKTQDNADTQRLVITHLSDITKHDAHMVFYMTKDCIDTLSNMHSNMKWEKIYLWSDGSASQYKGKHSFFYLDKFEVPVECNFYGTEHEKGESDAETGLISRQVSNAIKSRKFVISNACDMRDFLLKVNEKKDDSRVFKVITDNDINPIYQQFENVKVDTLEGSCTRTLHQIKPSGEKGILLKRPFSCFCKYCKIDEHEVCPYKKFTSGKFQPRKLHSNLMGANCEINDNVSDEEEDTDVFVVNENVDIEIKKQALLFKDLQVDDLIVVTVLTKQNQSRYYAAKINQKIGKNKVNIDYLKQNFDHPQVFTIANDMESNWDIHMENIVMKLPEPLNMHRGRYVFRENILLHKTKKK